MKLYKGCRTADPVEDKALCG